MTTQELRLEILKLAIDQADTAYYNELEKVRSAVIVGASGYELPEDNRVRQALRIAKKLCSFVEGDKNDSES